jgi:hypothetical protein
MGVFDCTTTSATVLPSSTKFRMPICIVVQQWGLITFLLPLVYNARSCCGEDVMPKREKGRGE